MYDKQAQVMLSYSIAKVIGVFTLVFFGFAVYGAIFEYLMGPLVGFAMGWYLFKFEGSKGDDIDKINDFEVEKIIDFAVPLIIFSVTFTFLISADLFFVKRILMENIETGYYTAASIVIYVVALKASLPLFFLPLLYVILFALYFSILFLMKELSKEDAETFKGIVHK